MILTTNNLSSTAGLVFLLLSTAVSNLHGTSATWNTTSTNANFSTGGNWSTGVAPGNTTGGIGGTGTDIATFNSAISGGFGNSTTPIVIDSGRTVRGITFDTSAGAFVLGTTGGNALSLVGGTNGVVQTKNTGTNSIVLNAPIKILGSTDVNYTFTSGYSSSSRTLSFGGGITGGSAGINVTLTLNGANIGTNTLSGVIGTGTSTSLELVKSSTGQWRLTNSNTYTGGTTVANGTLTLGHATNTLANSGAVTVTGGTLSLGSNSDTVGAVTLTGGTISSTSGVLTGSSYSVENGNVSAILGGSAALDKSNTGTVTLSGANTYSGATTVSGGTLNVSGSINSTSSVSVSGGTFVYGGAGTFNRTVNVNGGTFRNNGGNFTGTLNFTSGSVGGTNLAGVNLSIGSNKVISPGNSPGTLATGDVAFTDGGTYLWEINDLSIAQGGTAGTQGADPGWDWINGGANDLDLTGLSAGGFTLQLDDLASLSGWNSTGTYQWTLATFTSISGFNAGNIAIAPGGFDLNSIGSGYGFSLSADSTNLYLNYGAVPEPSSMYLLVAAGLFVVCSRRNRRVN